PNSESLIQGVPVSPDTAAQRHDSAVAQRPEGRGVGATGHDGDRGRPDRSGPEREGPAGSGRMWTYLTLAAAVAFAGTVTAVGTNLLTGPADLAEVSDTPEHAVEEFLGALLDDHDAAGAGERMCADKADRDLGEATAELASINERTGVDW